MKTRQLPKIISLFSGAGGLDLGFAKSGFDVVAAYDSDPTAIETHKRNFPSTSSLVVDLQETHPRKITNQLQQLIPPTTRIGIVGGPPCQGFSRANTNSRADDPRNSLPAVYLRLVKHLQQHFTVEFLVIENVLGIRDRKHNATYERIKSGMNKLGFQVVEMELHALDFGVPQARRRIVLVGFRDGVTATRFAIEKAKGPRTVREAIGHLASPAFYRRDISAAEIPIHPNHWTMQPKSTRFGGTLRPTKDGRSFKQLVWDEPSPTIAFGHREIHVHPNGARRLSIFEAMLLQGFPKHFVLVGNLSQQVEQVSNAVPPPVARSLANGIRRVLEA